MRYTVFMKSEWLTNEFIVIYNYYGYTVVLYSYNLSIYYWLIISIIRSKR